MNNKRKEIRYAVIGLGHIAQVAVLPAFRHAKKNSRLVALVSGDPKKRKKISEQYQIENVFSYDQYEQLLDSGLIDAVYICLPNHMHFNYAKMALEKGIHVLSEKPLAPSVEECAELVQLAKRNKLKFMTAYRLHFEPANLKAIEFAKSKKLGELRYFNSIFSFMIKDPDNIRLKNSTGGGTLWDIGIYCLNAARGLFQAEPIEVMAMTTAKKDKKFSEVEEMAGVVMKFPENRMANFVVSFGSEAVANFNLFGTKGSLSLENAYEYEEVRTLKVKTQKGERRFKFGKVDQFAPEIMYFSDCILKNKNVEPSGVEGLADVIVIQALYESAATGKTIVIPPLSEIEKKQKPNHRQKFKVPPVQKVEPVGVRSPS